MNIAETIFLGVVQGLTEFLPVSSSGHLVFFQNLLGLKGPELLLDCSLHLGTLLAVCIYFRHDLKKMAGEIRRFHLIDSSSPLFLWVLIGTLPTGFIGLVFKSPLERLFGATTIVGLMLIVTGFIVGSTRLIPKGHEANTRIGLLTALAVGTAQGLAIVPGISRSGATIACGLLFGLERDLAGRFSFLLSIPAIIGALALQLNVQAFERIGLAPLFFGFVSSALVGLVALRVLMGMVRRGHLYYFAPYCWAIGLIVVFAHLV